MRPREDLPCRLPRNPNTGKHRRHAGPKRQWQQNILGPATLLQYYGTILDSLVEPRSGLCSQCAPLFWHFAFSQKRESGTIGRRYCPSTGGEQARLQLPLPTKVSSIPLSNCANPSHLVLSLLRRFRQKSRKGRPNLAAKGSSASQRQREKK